MNTQSLNEDNDRIIGDGDLYGDEEEPHEHNTSHDVRPIVNTVLSYMCFDLNVGTPSNVKKIVMQTFSYSKIMRAHSLFLKLCAEHNRRIKDKCVSDFVAWLLDLKRLIKFRTLWLTSPVSLFFQNFT